MALVRVADALNGFIPGRPADDPAPLSVLANPTFDAALIQGIAAKNGIALSSNTDPKMAAIAPSWAASGAVPATGPDAPSNCLA